MLSRRSRPSILAFSCVVEWETMPTRHHQLDRILAAIDRQIAEAEAAMLKPLTDADLRTLTERQVDLRLLRREVQAELRSKNNPPSAH